MDYTIGKYDIPHDGRLVEGSLYLPATDGALPLVIFSHGYNGAKTDFATSAETLARSGVASYCFDFCGGSVRAQTALKTTEMTLFTEMQDLEAAIGALRGHPQIDKENLFLFGASQGGLVTAMTAARRADETRGMILLFPALCIADNWQERYPTAADIPEETELWGMKLGRKFFESIRSFDPFSMLGNYRRSVLILHGERDEVVPIAYSRRAQKLYPHADMVEFSGEGHGFSPAGEARMTQLLLAFVQENIH